MRKQGKELALQIVQILHQTHEKIKTAIENGDIGYAQNMLIECQQAGIDLGSSIEESEGEGFITVTYIETYCERLYQYFTEMEESQEANANKMYKVLRKLLLQIESSIKNDINIRLEVVFLPYKSSMWDSLESVWKAADADEDCDAYVIPIPYFDRNNDGTLKQEHWEGDQYPEYVPITRYDEYDFEKRQPDVVFIHNPYDGSNFVTTVHPYFYSDNIKKFTNCLVYIPYFATSGAMSEGQKLCPAYLNADYIVIQSEKFRKFYDPRIPDEKFLALGSPKFDSVIHKCQNPSEPPKEWKEKMKGKKVYFYNTSLGGMLQDTEVFLNKMQYVFDAFKGQDKACLLWRPHPLMESTFDSMKPQFKPVYEALKKEFIDSQIGIYDDTPDIEKTIAHCDVYIGDAGTSVTSLFGVTGKPIFLLNNYVNTEPADDDWRGEIIKGFFLNGHDEWMITQGNKLYHSPNKDYNYEYYCDLSDYAGGNYYLRAMSIQDKIYVCPANAQDILVIKDKKIINRIKLEREIETGGAFCGAWQIGKYIFLLPMNYPAVVRYNTQNNKVDYIKGINDLFVRNIQGRWRVGGFNIWKQYLVLSSPSDDKVIFIDSNTLEIRLLAVNSQNYKGSISIVNKDNMLWLLPYTGKTIIKWNPQNGEIREYSDVPQGFSCRSWPEKQECEEYPFGNIAFYQNKAIVSPSWGNMLISIDMETGKAQEWKLPFETVRDGKNGYFLSSGIGGFIKAAMENKYQFFYTPERKLYEVDLSDGSCSEINIEFSKEVLNEHESGFSKESEWQQYSCIENSINTLKRLIDDELYGSEFDKEEQLKAYTSIAANNDGTSGEKIYNYVKTH